VAVEGDAEHVVHLTLEGLDPGMEIEQRRHRRIVLGHLDAQADAFARPCGEQPDDDLEALGLDATRQVATGRHRGSRPP
jgi:hypothetical protein